MSFICKPGSFFEHLLATENRAGQREGGQRFNGNLPGVPDVSCGFQVGAERFGFAMSPHGFWLQSSGTVQPANLLPEGTRSHSPTGSEPDGLVQETIACGPQKWSDVVVWALFHQKHCWHEVFKTSPPHTSTLNFLLTLTTSQSHGIYFSSFCAQKRNSLRLTRCLE